MLNNNHFYRDVHVIRAAKRICSAVKIVRTLTLFAVAVLIGFDTIGLLKRSV